MLISDQTQDTQTFDHARLVNICQEFALERNLRFGTNEDPAKSKTKCIVYAKKGHNLTSPAPIILDGKELPLVKKITHLGCTLEEDNSMRIDITIKRSQFIARVNSLLQEFRVASAKLVLSVFLLRSIISTFSVYKSS